MNSMDDLEDLEKIQPVKRSRAGFILSIIGAIIVLLFALVLVYMSFNPSLTEEEQLEIALKPFAEQMGMTAEESFAFLLSTMGIIGIVCAILIVIGALLAYYKGMRVAGGIIVLLFSILSIFSSGGFFIGMILGIVGGALILATK